MAYDEELAPSASFKVLEYRSRMQYLISSAEASSTGTAVVVVVVVGLAGWSCT